MSSLPSFDASVPTRDLVRLFRVPPHEDDGMPESVLWKAFMELRRRGEPTAGSHFIAGLRSLHRRRTFGASELGLADPDPEEHRLAEDPYLQELWRSYKRAIANNRTGPAAQILREVEQQVVTH